MASNQCLWESYLKCHTVAVSVLGYDEPLLEMTSSVGDLQMALLELNRFIHANAYKVSVSDSLPPGYLYMVGVIVFVGVIVGVGVSVLVGVIVLVGVSVLVGVIVWLGQFG